MFKYLLIQIVIASPQSIPIYPVSRQAQQQQIQQQLQHQLQQEIKQVPRRDQQRVRPQSRPEGVFEPVEALNLSSSVSANSLFIFINVIGLFIAKI